MNRINKLDVIVAGHVCLDIIPTFRENKKVDLKDIFMPGKLINMGKVKIFAGGPVSNTGIALSILGINTKLMGKIGNDFFGKDIRKILKERNINNGMTVIDSEETSYTLVIAPKGYDRIFLHNPGANNTFCADDIQYEKVKQAKLFHFGYPPLMEKVFENEGEELAKIFKKVKELGATTSLDMSLPDPSSKSGKVDWEKILKRILPFIDIYIPSVEETMFMIEKDEFNYINENSGHNDMLEKLDINKLPLLGEKLISYGAKVVVLKCGVKGCYIRTQGKDVLRKMGRAKPADLNNWSARELHEESFHVSNIASATGSGDSSIAGFLAAFLNGKTIEESIRIACAVGGQNVKVLDAISGIKPWNETLEMIHGWKKNKLKIQSGYWTYDRKKKFWAGKKDIRFKKGSSSFEINENIEK